MFGGKFNVHTRETHSGRVRPLGQESQPRLGNGAPSGNLFHNHPSLLPTPSTTTTDYLVVAPIPAQNPVNGKSRPDWPHSSAALLRDKRICIRCAYIKQTDHSSHPFHTPSVASSSVLILSTPTSSAHMSYPRRGRQSTTAKQGNYMACVHSA